MAASHTRGPWEIRRTGNAAKDISIFVEGDAPSSGCICKLPHRDGRETTTLANANLIAAAPDLLAACKALQMEASARGCGLRIADEAITKAEGA
jgi:hypothetical protein